MFDISLYINRYKLEYQCITIKFGIFRHLSFVYVYVVSTEKLKSFYRDYLLKSVPIK